MKKILVSVIFAAFPLLCASQQIKLEGTNWVGVDGLQQVKFEMTFLAGGVYKYSTYDKAGNKVLIDGGVFTGTWEQNGSSLIMRNPFSEKRGTISGNFISGSATARGGQSWTWSYQMVNQAKTSSGNSELKPEIHNKANPKLESSSSQLSAPQAKSQPAPSNLKQSGNRVVDTPQTLEQQAFCFGVFNGLKSLNIGFNQSGNNEYFKKYKNEFFKTYTPILDKVEPCVNSNRPVTGNVMLQCGKKTLNDKEYQLFIRNTAGYADVVEANQKRDEFKLDTLRFICSVIIIN